MAAPRTCRHLDILSWQAMLWHCRGQMGASTLRRTDHVVTGQMVVMVHGVCCPLVQSQGRSIA